VHRIELSLFTNEWPWYATEFKQFCRGEPRNFANWPTEFGKICRRKLWALMMMVLMFVCEEVALSNTGCLLSRAVLNSRFCYSGE